MGVFGNCPCSVDRRSEQHIGRNAHYSTKTTTRPPPASSQWRSRPRSVGCEAVECVAADSGQVPIVHVHNLSRPPNGRCRNSQSGSRDRSQGRIHGQYRSSARHCWFDLLTQPANMPHLSGRLRAERDPSARAALSSYIPSRLCRYLPPRALFALSHV